MGVVTAASWRPRAALHCMGSGRLTGGTLHNFQPRASTAECSVANARGTVYRGTAKCCCTSSSTATTLEAWVPTTQKIGPTATTTSDPTSAFFAGLSQRDASAASNDDRPAAHDRAVDVLGSHLPSRDTRREDAVPCSLHSCAEAKGRPR